MTLSYLQTKCLPTCDPNGTADSIIFIAGNTPPEISGAVGDSASFSVAFGTDASGKIVLKAAVLDNDGYWSDTLFDTVTVRRGAPVITGITPNGGIWVNDVTEFTIAAGDTNGTVDSIFVDHDNDGIWDLRSIAGTLSWAFDTACYGTTPVVVLVKDDDGVWTVDTFDIEVGLGRPIISGNSC